MSQQADEPERRIWDQTLKGMRPGYYSEAFAPLLHSYCMTGVVAEQLQAEMRTLTLEHPR